MATCFKCRATIDHLINHEPVEDVYQFKLNILYEPQYEMLYKTNTVAGDFECPKCKNVLFTNEAEAIAFLSGEPEVVADPAMA